MGMRSRLLSTAHVPARRIWNWTPSWMVHWAQTIGPHTARLFERILADKPHPEMGYRSCLGIIRLADQYSPARMEAAAKLCYSRASVGIRALRLHRRRHLRTTTSVAESTSSEETAMLKQPMVEKLAAMRLLGMIEALKAQE